MQKGNFQLNKGVKYFIYSKTAWFTKQIPFYSQLVGLAM